MAKKVKKERKWLKRLVRGIKKSPSKKRPSRKTGKKKESKRKAGQKEEVEVGFEEVVIKCPSCGREFRIVKSSGFSAEGMLCQRCASGGGIGFEEEGDI